MSKMTSVNVFKVSTYLIIFEKKIVYLLKMHDMLLTSF